MAIPKSQSLSRNPNKSSLLKTFLRLIGIGHSWFDRAIRRSRRCRNGDPTRAPVSGDKSDLDPNAINVDDPRFGLGIPIDGLAAWVGASRLPALGNWPLRKNKTP
jgi:hypothetical protein